MRTKKGLLLRETASLPQDWRFAFWNHANLNYSVNPMFSMCRLRVGVMVEPVTFLFIR